jgi:hypothetical protein
VLDEADEMLSQGFKEQIYDIYRYLPPATQVLRLAPPPPTPPSSRTTTHTIRRRTACSCVGCLLGIRWAGVETGGRC